MGANSKEVGTKDAGVAEVATPVLTREQILGAGKLARQRVNVPGWDGVVIVSEITAAEVEAWQVYVAPPPGPENENGEAPAPPAEMSRVRIMASLLVRTITDENGVRLFTDDDEAVFTAKPLNTLSRLFMPAAIINGIDIDAEESAAGNSDAGQTFGSSTS